MIDIEQRNQEIAQARYELRTAAARGINVALSEHDRQLIEHARAVLDLLLLSQRLASPTSQQP